MIRAFVPLLFALATAVNAQSVSTDTSDVILTEEAFLDLVATHHPLAVRAELQRDRARANLLEARGGFDPKFFADLDQKYFKGTRYYNEFRGGVKVPTWYGIELNAEYERNDGTFLNPELTVPDDGLYAAGLSISLGQGLLFDRRRAELRRAQINQALTEAERVVQFNELLYEAGKSYWEWAEAQGVVSIYEDAVDLTRTRYEATIAGALLGDRPAIDTLEARIQLQNRILSLEAARLDLNNAAARLNAFLWLDGVVPVELEPSMIPPAQSTILVAPLASVPLPDDNPELLRTRAKLDQLEIDERLQREFLKPRVDVKYNLLLGGGVSDPVESLSTNDYKWGLTFAQPLLLRKERGKLALVRIKQSETQFELTDKTALLQVKVAQAENEAAATAAQYDVAVQNTDDYSVLLDGERELFRAGESSLFLVNSREVSFIDAQIKQVELLVKHRKARQARSFYLGRMLQRVDADLPIE